MTYSDIAMLLPLLIIVPFYGYFVYIFYKRQTTRRLEKTFFRAVISVLNNSQNDQECIEQLEINFKKMREKNPSSSSEAKASLDFLEDMFHYYDTLGEKTFKTRFNLEVTTEIRNRIVNIMNEMKRRNPFASLSRENANLLNDLKHSIESGNIELGTRTIRQLAEEIKIKESNVSIQERRNRNSLVIAVIGAVLTLFFGLFTFISIF